MQRSSANRRRRRSRPERSALIAAIAIAVVAGCSGGEGLHPVRGTVVFDGEPLSKFDNAAVVFTPKGGRLAAGVVNRDGTFELETQGIGAGAPAGPARVSVSATVDAPMPGMERHSGVRWVIPETFGNPDTSTMTYEVVPGNNVVRIVLTSAGTASIESE